MDDADKYGIPTYLVPTQESAKKIIELIINPREPSEAMKELFMKKKLQAAWKNRAEVGSCNFCNDDAYYRVLEIRGVGNITVRICAMCFRELKRLGVK